MLYAIENTNDKTGYLSSDFLTIARKFIKKPRYWKVYITRGSGKMNTLLKGNGVKQFVQIGEDEKAVTAISAWRVEIIETQLKEKGVFRLFFSPSAAKRFIKETAPHPPAEASAPQVSADTACEQKMQENGNWVVISFNADRIKIYHKKVLKASPLKKKYKILKSFETEKEAQDFCQEYMKKYFTNARETADRLKCFVPFAFVDGSHLPDKNASGSAFVMSSFKGNQPYAEAVRRTGKKVSSSEAEIDAASMAIKHAMTRGAEHLSIFYDAAVVVEALDVREKAKRNKYKDYIALVRKAQKQMDVEFIKVKGHSGNIGNEFVDDLSRDAAKGRTKKLVL